MCLIFTGLLEPFSLVWAGQTVNMFLSSWEQTKPSYLLTAQIGKKDLGHIWMFTPLT